MSGVSTRAAIGDSVNIRVVAEDMRHLITTVPPCPKCGEKMEPRITWDGVMKPAVVCGRCGFRLGPREWGVR